MAEPRANLAAAGGLVVIGVARKCSCDVLGEKSRASCTTCGRFQPRFASTTRCNSPVSISMSVRPFPVRSLVGGWGDLALLEIAEDLRK